MSSPRRARAIAPAEAADDKYHGVGAFDVVTGAQAKPQGQRADLHQGVRRALVDEARRDDKIVAVTAAMPGGTGLDRFGDAYPDRAVRRRHRRAACGDLRRRPGHRGFKPFCAIYSTFLQRGYDQVVHDVAIQNLPVRFAIDRAGLVGADGATHAGAFDLAYLACLPGIVVMAAADEAELVHMVATAAADRRPARRASLSARRRRRRRDAGTGARWQIGKGRVLREGNAVALLSLGTRLAECLKAADELAARGLSTTVADARFAKPIDHELICASRASTKC